ncbi:MAG: hypothetical protein CALGDGBN_02329 [Pseudomonadales bacterium]|nr:hypothetical protein [Pseudomonadales bacterium]
MKLEYTQLGLLVPAIILMVMAILRPKWPTYTYIGILICFSATTYGLIPDADSVGTIYGRGKGLLPISLINVLLIALVIHSCLVARRKYVFASPEIGHYLAAYCAMFFCYATYGIVSGVSLERILAWQGVFNVVNMALLYLLLRRTFSTTHQLRNLCRFIFVLGMARCAWGLLRFVLLEGDPANYYANYQDITIKLTYFDINDSLVAMLVIAISIWESVYAKQLNSRIWRYMYLLGLVAGLLTIVFSYRRTAWIGLALALIPLLWQLPRRIRIIALSIFVPVTAAFIAITTLQRFGDTGESVGFTMSLFFGDVFDRGGNIDTKRGRFSELIAASRAIANSPAFGIAPWGQIDQFFQDFIHSGLLHVMLKTGLVGFGIFAAATVAYVVFVVRNRQRISTVNRGPLEAGFAGFLFMLPTLLFGTPIIEYRTMQMYGLIFAMPYIAVAAQAAGRKYNDSRALRATRDDCISKRI